MLTLADIIRTIHGNLSRKQLKVARAKLRRMGVTNLNQARRNGPYSVDVTTDLVSDRRAQGGNVVVGAAAVSR